MTVVFNSIIPKLTFCSANPIISVRIGSVFSIDILSIIRKIGGILLIQIISMVGGTGTTGTVGIGAL